MNRPNYNVGDNVWDFRGDGPFKVTALYAPKAEGKSWKVSVDNDGPEFNAEVFHRRLEFGDPISSKARVIRYTHIHNGGNGFNTHGVVLCVKPFGLRDQKARKHREEFVVWNAYHDAHGWHAETGSYFFDFFEAVEKFKERGGK